MSTSVAQVLDFKAYIGTTSRALELWDVVLLDSSANNSIRLGGSSAEQSKPAGVVIESGVTLNSGRGVLIRKFGIARFKLDQAVEYGQYVKPSQANPGFVIPADSLLDGVIGYATQTGIAGDTISGFVMCIPSDGSGLLDVFESESLVVADAEHLEFVNYDFDLALVREYSFSYGGYRKGARIIVQRVNFSTYGPKAAVPAAADSYYGQWYYDTNDGVLYQRQGPGFRGVASTDFPPDYVHGAALEWVSATSVKVGTSNEPTYLRDQRNRGNIIFSGTLTADITSSGAGGLDTGAEAADTWYGVFIIGDSTGVNTPKAMLSISKDNPTMPAGYDRFRRVGWVRNNGSSNFRRFMQNGAGAYRRYHYDEERSLVQPLSGGTATTFTDVPLTAFMPVTAKRCEVVCGFDTTSPSQFFEIRPDGSSVADPATFGVVGVAAPTAITQPMCIHTSDTQTFEYMVSAAGASLDVYVVGYEDEL